MRGTERKDGVRLRQGGQGQGGGGHRNESRGRQVVLPCFHTLSDAFIQQLCQVEDSTVKYDPGVYRVESRGVLLYSRAEYFPLVPYVSSQSQMCA